MTDTAKLKQIIKRKGYKLSYIAAQLGISRCALQMKVENRSDFKGKEIATLSLVLSLSASERDEIFFSKIVAK